VSDICGEREKLEYVEVGSLVNEIGGYWLSLRKRLAMLCACHVIIWV
jgi:hypothetical protein